MYKAKCNVINLQEVIVDFEAHTVSDNDFNGIRKLLQQASIGVRSVMGEHDVIRADPELYCIMKARKELILSRIFKAVGVPGS